MHPTACACKQSAQQTCPSKPRDVQGRDLANFDHVKRDLRIAAGDEEPANNLNAKSEDAQRILARLNTQEASKVPPPLP